MTQFGVRPWLGNPKFASRASRIYPSEVERRDDRLVGRIQKALDQPQPGAMQTIAEEVAAKHGLSSWRELRSHTRGRAMVQARWECWTRCRQETEHSYPAIGRFFGFDHSAILDGVRNYLSRKGA